MICFVGNGLCLAMTAPKTVCMELLAMSFLGVSNDVFRSWIEDVNDGLQQRNLPALAIKDTDTQFGKFLVDSRCMLDVISGMATQIERDRINTLHMMSTLNAMVHQNHQLLQENKAHAKENDGLQEDVKQILRAMNVPNHDAASDLYIIIPKKKPTTK